MYDFTVVMCQSSPHCADQMSKDCKSFKTSEPLNINIHEYSFFTVIICAFYQSYSGIMGTSLMCGLINY